MGMLGVMLHALLSNSPHAPGKTFRAIGLHFHFRSPLLVRCRAVHLQLQIIRLLQPVFLPHTHAGSGSTIQIRLHDNPHETTPEIQADTLHHSSRDHAIHRGLVCHDPL